MLYNKYTRVKIALNNFQTDVDKEKLIYIIAFLSQLNQVDLNEEQILKFAELLEKDGKENVESIYEAASLIGDVVNEEFQKILH